MGNISKAWKRFMQFKTPNSLCINDSNTVKPFLLKNIGTK